MGGARDRSRWSCANETPARGRDPLHTKPVSLNYPFIVGLAGTYAAPPARLLDFGCGGGEIVALAAERGFDAWGVDTYQGVWEQYAHAPGRLDGRIVRMAPGQILPFDDAVFDIVVSNQVFEHVADMAPAVRELARVLRPGGVLIAVFPTREIIREPHLRAPFVHWFVTGSPAQAWALRISHALGLHNAPGRGRDDWVAEAQASLRRDMFYRRERGALAAFAPEFTLAARREADFIRDRIGHSSRIGWLSGLARRAMFEPLLRRACLRLAGVVFVLQRVPAAG